jgi:diacylglycerol kinase family enzyme
MTVKDFDKEAEYVFKDITALNINEFLKEASEDDDIIIVGGDGTLNVFVNQIEDTELKNDIYYYPAGSGNDFMNDVGGAAKNGIIKINSYVSDLPIAVIKGKKYRFINGIGFGLDGYCCEESDKIQKKSSKPVNYTKIALKGFLYDFHPKNATVTVDGVIRTYKNVWLAPTMNGKYYGGGIKITPDQDRLNPKRTVSTLVMHHKHRLKILMAFPSAFEGLHVVKHKKLVDVFEGNEVTVTFDKPCAVQVDGETILDVLSYTVYSGKAKEKLKEIDFAEALKEPVTAE